MQLYSKAKEVEPGIGVHWKVQLLETRQIMINTTDSTSPIHVAINHETAERLIQLVTDHPEVADHINRRINRAIEDIVTLEEYAIKIDLYQKGIQKPLLTPEEMKGSGDDEYEVTDNT